MALREERKYRDHPQYYFLLCFPFPQEYISVTLIAVRLMGAFSTLVATGMRRRQVMRFKLFCISCEYMDSDVRDIVSPSVSSEH